MKLTVNKRGKLNVYVMTKTLLPLSAENYQNQLLYSYSKPKVARFETQRIYEDNSRFN